MMDLEWELIRASCNSVLKQGIEREQALLRRDAERRRKSLWKVRARLEREDNYRQLAEKDKVKSCQSQV